MTSLSDKNLEESPNEREWNEAALAELVGLENQARVENADAPILLEENNIISQGDLFDSPSTDPHENKTERSLAKKPLPKLGLVAVGLLGVFGIGGLALSSMMGVKKPSLTNPLTQSSTENKTSIVDKKADENQEGQLKTQLAIASQAEDLKAIDERSKDKKSEAVKPGEKDKTPTLSSTPQPVNSTPTTSYRPPPPTPVAYSPPVRSPSPPPPPLAQPLRSPNPVASPLPPVPPNQSAAQQLDPVEQWNRLAMLGSYGRVGGTDEAIPQTGQVSAPVENLAQPVNAAMIQQIHSPVVNVEDENRVLRGITVKRLVPGTVAAASLSTSLVWSEESQTESHFVVTLAESLVDVDGNEAIRAGQQIVFSVTAVDSNGLVTVTAVSLIDEQGVETSLPPGAITVQRNSETPLLAEGFFDPGGDIASMDLGIAGLGTVAKIGEILNRPKQQQQQSISGSQISTTTSSTTGDPNIIGALMEGAATPVLESIQKRNQEAIERLSEQNNVWFLPVGESVQVIVTKAFDL